MEETNSLIEQRKANLAKLREKGIDPFKNKFTPDRSCDDARSKFDKGELPETTKVSVAGRITAHRDMGKSIFIDVRDQSGRVQVYAQKQALAETLAWRAMLAVAATRTARAQAAPLVALREGLRAEVRQVTGIDLARQHFTERGFEPD